MNLPAIEFQKKNGTKAQRVVRVPLSTGQNMRVPAALKASTLFKPSAIFRSAYSTTTIPPSTRMPTASTRPNMTIWFRLTLMALSIRKPRAKQTGMARPTMSPCRTPRLATMIIMTSRVAERRPPSRTTRVRSINSESSKV